MAVWDLLCCLGYNSRPIPGRDVAGSVADHGAGRLTVMGFEPKTSPGVSREERWGDPVVLALLPGDGDPALRNTFGKHRRAYLLYRAEILPKVRKVMQHPFRIEIISIVRD